MIRSPRLFALGLAISAGGVASAQRPQPPLTASVRGALIDSPDALAAEITRELRRVHNDGHLRVVHDPDEAARAADTTRREVRDASARDRRANFYFRDARILAGNIGYSGVLAVRRHE